MKLNEQTCPFQRVTVIKTAKKVKKGTYKSARMKICAILMTNTFMYLTKKQEYTYQCTFLKKILF